MSILFNAKDHSYKSNDDSEIIWISVTTLVSHFKKPFDAEKIAKKVIKNKKSILELGAGYGDFGAFHPQVGARSASGPAIKNPRTKAGEREEGRTFKEQT